MKEAPSNDLVQKALAELGALEHQMLQGGAVDSEPDLFNQVRDALVAGKITAHEAVRRARDIAEGRQNYH